MKTYGEVEVLIHLSWAQQEIEVSGYLHASVYLLLEKKLLLPIGYEAGWASEPVWIL
jgi:hypothetical protein